jgi:tRNA pseudouridine38-40 synthase
LAQVVTFVTESSVPAANFVRALNDILPASVRVLEVAEAAENFHARKSAHAKTYRYRIYRAAICPPFLARYVWHYPYPLGEAAMKQAAALVEGEHDFTSFAAVDPERNANAALERNLATAAEPERSAGACPEQSRRVPPASADSENAQRREGTQSSNIRRIFSSTWQRQGEEFIYTVTGSGFLHHMVRNLVGTFILMGKETLRPEEVTRILEARKRSAAGATAPASGLYLVNVEY